MANLSIAQKTDMQAVKQTISAFAAAADNSNADDLNQYLDDNFRIVMNRLFGSSEVSVMPKTVYLDKIRKKEFGGDDREVTIKNIVINGTTASAQVTYAGKKMTFVAITTLIKDGEGNWKLASETPVVL